MIKVIIYDNQYRDQLEQLLIDMSEELYSNGTVNIDQFIDNHWVIYLAMKDDEVIGLSSFFYNTYFGLRTPTVGNTYLYVKPAHRRGRASYLLSIQAAFVSVDTSLPLETYYASDSSRVMSKRMQGEHLYDVWLYDPDEMAKAYNHTTRNDKLRKDK